MTPRIAIPVPTSTDVPYNQRSWPSYARAVALSGGEPVAIGLDLPAATLRELIASCDGVLLPGSPADVDPGLYGADRDPPLLQPIRLARQLITCCSTRRRSTESRCSGFALECNH